MVGRRLAAHTRPVAWVKGRVDVAVDEPGWHSQLESMAKDVRKQVNSWWGSELLREVRFVPEKARRPRPAAEPEKNARTPAEHKLSAALEELAPALKGIADADLRELVARVAGQYLARQAKK
jgi:hypothetical protein